MKDKYRSLDELMKYQTQGIDFSQTVVKGSGVAVIAPHGALQFDSSDVEGVIEDLDLLMSDFLDKIAKASADYLDAGEGGDADERLERLVYGRFLEPEPRKAFFEAYSLTVR